MKKLKSCYVENDGVNIYYDKNGNIFEDGDYIRFEDGRIEKVYLTDQGLLGTDATNPSWIKNGRAFPCEYGIYPLENSELKEIEVVINK